MTTGRRDVEPRTIGARVIGVDEGRDLLGDVPKFVNREREAPTHLEAAGERRNDHLLP